MRRHLSKFFRGFIENPIVGFFSIISGLVSLIEILAQICAKLNLGTHFLEIWNKVGNENIRLGICIAFAVVAVIKCVLSMNAARYRLTYYPLYIKDLILQTEIILAKLTYENEYDGNLKYAIKDACQYCSSQLDNLCNIMSQMTGARVSGCVKVFMEEDQLMDFARSSITGKNRQNKKTCDGGDTIYNNTDFLSIQLGLLEDNSFYQCDLRDFARQLENNGYRYENSTVEWYKKYRGVGVVPICSVYAGEEELYGFLCVDTSSGSAFRKKYKMPTVNILEIYADNFQKVIVGLTDYIDKVNNINKSHCP